MSDNQIHCPHCNELISIDQVLSNQIEDTLRREFAEKQKQQDQQFLAKKEQLELEAEKMTKRQDELKRQSAEIVRQKEQAQAEIEEKVAYLLQTQKADLLKTARDQARIEAEKEQNEKTSLLEEQLKAKEDKLKAATAKEIELLKERSKLAEEKDQFELEKIRQLEEAKKQIHEEATKKATEEQHYIILQMQKKLDDATKAKDELARKLEQGSQQTQGEVLELELESLLMAEFPHDDIKPVPKGVYGADIIHRVLMKNGSCCGTIVWESKKTKTWTEGWVQKLKDDQRSIKADIAVLVSSVLPAGITGIGQYNGIWVCDVKSANALCVLLRHSLEGVHREKAMSVGKNEKMEMVYAYLAGSEFKQRIEALLEAYMSMRDDLNKERILFERNWSKREKQLLKMMQNTSGMYGELGGMITLQRIKHLEIGDEDESGENHVKQTLDLPKPPEKTLDSEQNKLL